MLSRIVLVPSLLMALLPTASAGVYQWTYSNAGNTVVGTFETSVTSGTIDENDVTSHSYVVNDSAGDTWTFDLVAGTVTDSTGANLTVTDAVHDFEYVIGSDSFVELNSSMVDSDFPTDFGIEVDGSWVGLYWDIDDDFWGLEAVNWPFIPDVSSVGWASGPAITAVPEPSSLVLGAIGALGLFGYGRRRRQKSAAA